MNKVLEPQHQSFQWIFRNDFHWDWLVWSRCIPRESQESSPTPQCLEFEFIFSLQQIKDGQKLFEAPPTKNWANSLKTGEFWTAASNRVGQKWHCQFEGSGWHFNFHIFWNTHSGVSWSSCKKSRMMLEDLKCLLAFGRDALSDLSFSSHPAWVLDSTNDDSSASHILTEYALKILRENLPNEPISFWFVT